MDCLIVICQLFVNRSHHVAPVHFPYIRNGFHHHHDASPSLSASPPAQREAPSDAGSAVLIFSGYEYGSLLSPDRRTARLRRFRCTGARRLDRQQQVAVTGRVAATPVMSCFLYLSGPPGNVFRGGSCPRRGVRIGVRFSFLHSSSCSLAGERSCSARPPWWALRHAARLGAKLAGHRRCILLQRPGRCCPMDTGPGYLIVHP